MKFFLHRYLSLFAAGIFLSLAVAGCISEPQVPPTRAVIDGWIDSDGYPVVQFTASISPDETGTSIGDKMIRWGKVTISDGTDTIIMTGGPDRGFFPPYKYYTYRMQGQPGKTYTVTAEYKDLYATASCFMFPPTPIKGVNISHIEGSDTLRAAELTFVAPDDCPAYYYITMVEPDLSRRPLPTMLSTVKATVPGEEMTVPVFRPKTDIDTLQFVPQLHVGQQVEINLCRVPQEVYDFWVGYDSASMFGGSQFINDSETIRGNVEGGYGIFSAQGTSSISVEVK